MRITYIVEYFDFYLECNRVMLVDGHNPDEVQAYVRLHLLYEYAEPVPVVGIRPK